MPDDYKPSKVIERNLQMVTNSLEFILEKKSTKNK